MENAGDAVSGVLRSRPHSSLPSMPIWLPLDEGYYIHDRPLPVCPAAREVLQTSEASVLQPQWHAAFLS